MMRPRVLLVDDDALIRRSLRRTLESDARFDVFCAEDAASAAAVIESERLDGIIVDLGLPGDGRDSDGWAVIALARKKDPTIDAVLITGSGEASANRAERNGVRFLAKPIDPEDLWPFYDAVWARIAGIAHLARGITAIAEATGLTVRQRQLLVLVAGGKREAEILELTGYSARTYSDHLSPVMKAVESVTGFAVKNARDAAYAVSATMWRAQDLPRALGVVDDER